MPKEINDPLFGKLTEVVSKATESFEGQLGVLFIVRDGSVAAMAGAEQSASNEDIKKYLLLIASRATDMANHIGKAGFDLSGQGHCFVKNYKTGQYEEQEYKGFITPERN